MLDELLEAAAGAGDCECGSDDTRAAAAVKGCETDSDQGEGDELWEKELRVGEGLSGMWSSEIRIASGTVVLAHDSGEDGIEQSRSGGVLCPELVEVPPLLEPEG